MEIVKADLRAPDITAFTKSLKEQNKLAAVQAKRIDEIAKLQSDAAAQQKREADASEKRRVAQEAERAAAKKAAEERRRLQEAEKAAADAAKKAEQEKRREMEATERARQEEIDQLRKLDDLLRTGSESLRKVGDGAFTFARGLSLATIGNGAALEGLLRTLTGIQSKFDLFRGGVDTFEGMGEAAGALNEAIKTGSSLSALLNARFDKLGKAARSLIGFLGPQGLIVAGATAAAAAIATVYFALQEETETALERSERRLDEFIRRVQRESQRAANAFERNDAVRDTRTEAERINALRGDLAGLGGRRSFDLDADAARRADIEARRQQEIERARRSGSQFALAGALGGLDAEAEQISPARRLAQVEAELAKERERQKLTGGLRTATEGRDKAADTAREASIRDAELETSRRRDEAERVRERLATAEEARKEEARRRANELSQLSPAERARVEGARGNISSLGDAKLKYLLSLAPANLGQDINDEFTRRGGEAPAERVDEVAGLKAELASLTAALRESEGNLTGLREGDAVLDAEAADNLSTINQGIREIANTIQVLKDQQDELEAQIQQSQ